MRGTGAVKFVCEDEARHTKCPTGYNQWHEWASRKAKTHRQTQCPKCGLWAIWIKKAASAPLLTDKEHP